MDILADFKSKDIYERILLRNGYSMLFVLPFLRIDGIEHYIKYQNEKYYHIHTYYKMKTGNHYIKEYMYEYSNKIFQNCIIVNGIKTVNPMDELNLLLMRLAMKQSRFFSNIKIKELQRFKYIIKAIYHNEILAKLSTNSEQQNKLLGELICREDRFKINLFQYKQFYKKFKIYSTLKFYSLYLFKRGYLVVLGLRKRSNKILATKWVSFTIMGTDGSGKSSMVAKIATLFKAKTATKVFYLGGNNKTYSIETRVYLIFYKVLRIFSPFKDQSYLAWFFYSLGLLEYGKVKDRKRKVVKGEKLKQASWVVIYERFPVVGLFDYPNKLNLTISSKWSKRTLGRLIVKLISKIRAEVDSIHKPDLVFLLVVDFEVMLNRRKMAANEISDIKNKLSTQQNYLAINKDSLIKIDNNGLLSESFSKITNYVNSYLCK